MGMAFDPFRLSFPVLYFSSMLSDRDGISCCCLQGLLDISLHAASPTAARILSNVYEDYREHTPPKFRSLPGYVWIIVSGYC